MVKLLNGLRKQVYLASDVMVVRTRVTVSSVSRFYAKLS